MSTNEDDLQQTRVLVPHNHVYVGGEGITVIDDDTFVVDGIHYAQPHNGERRMFELIDHDVTYSHLDVGRAPFEWGEIDEDEWLKFGTIKGKDSHERIFTVTSFSQSSQSPISHWPELGYIEET